MQSLPVERTPHWLNKVPDVALSLRIGEIMSITVGETGADYLAVNVGLGRIVTRIAMASRLAIALWMQLHALRGAVVLPTNGGAGQHRRYADRRPAHRRSERQPPRERDDQRGALAAIFIVRHRVERTLSIDTIVMPRCERLYVGPIRQRNKRGATNTAPERQPPIVPRSILRDRMIDVVVRSTPSSVPIWSSRSLSRSGESARSHAT